MVKDQGYTTTQTARELGIDQSLLRTWRKKYGRAAAESSGLSESNQEELVSSSAATASRTWSIRLAPTTNEVIAGCVKVDVRKY